MPSDQVFNSGPERVVYTTSNGAPYAEPYEAQRVTMGSNRVGGSLLLQDFHLIDLLSHFDRERIPERVVHAKGGGAHGIFEATHDISDICCAKLFTPGKKTPLTTRFSTVGGESGSADTARDPRGFSIKLRTEEGNLDWVFNNTPVFFLRDPAKFPAFIHTQKRDPQTHLKDADMFWDYLSQNPESIHQVMILFGDRGIPKAHDLQHGYSGHTFKLVNHKGEWVYAQIHVRSDQGTDFYTQEEGVRLAGENPDIHNQKLFEQIEKGKPPSWTVSVQTMTQEQAEKFRYSVFDLTKVWPHSEFPLRPIGKMTLNKNPENYFAEIEQVAFSPSHLVPGIEPSADPVLQSRLFSYPDTHRHRLGVNYQQIPVNAPLVPVASFQRDGAMCVNGNQGARPNYQSTIQPLSYSKRPTVSAAHENSTSAEIQNFLSQVDELDFEQPRALWEKVFDAGAKKRFISNVSGHISGCKSKEIVDRQLGVFARVSPEIADGIKRAISA
ncbi:catalase [Violaceomyces palustris]|uniref:Catalase n=1 Tax=Violaceomyces palustris TaxID=1673888 RepID=A0ACD0P770_9BASI|nr:catalase [Violaceomyces palustris]